MRDEYQVAAMPRASCGPFTGWEHKEDAGVLSGGPMVAARDTGGWSSQPSFGCGLNVLVLSSGPPGAGRLFIGAAVWDCLDQGCRLVSAKRGDVQCDRPGFTRLFQESGRQGRERR